MLVAQDEVRLEQYVKQSNGQWLLFESSSLDNVVELSSISCSLALRDVYDKVSLTRLNSSHREIREISKETIANPVWLMPLGFHSLAVVAV